MIIEQSIRISSSKEAVFDYLQDFNNRTAFINYIDEVRLISEKKEGLGTRYVEVATILGRKLETVYEVVQFDKPRFIQVKSIGAIFPILSGIEFKSEKEKTKLILKIEVDLPMLMRIGAPLIKGFIDSEAQRILKAIKNKVERIDKEVN